ncbi:hypothetical protein BGP77_11415 [Saccharospirillum sp. MSK14-1]|uniref:hypothetical protein n=1 Tax=Saccharospirillum sp. MSK14-1 TaxID=1897632 RepID=UPI000D33FF10|nr:hypothetical protein [Saccharospirillum sp. MSK14-1]PTY38549.1 hypothetical protein BGP77_11415 [Saccharospirillum sp. MSK14-1]
MAITKTDVKLMQPERLTDNDDGGGSMTGLPVIDGEINNLFEDASRINRTYGNVSMRKAFLKIDTATADLYLDAHAIISAQPKDPNVSGLLFTTEDFYDERKNSRQRVEAFTMAGARTGIKLRGNQNKGQQSIICFSGNGSVSAPASGETYMLQIGEDITTRQFVKVTDVTETNEVFTYTQTIGQNIGVKTFPVRQWIIELSTELERDYPNIDPHPWKTQLTFVHDTNPSVSSKYYGTSQLTEAIAAGATSINVKETFSPIIPTASSETALIDQKPAGLIDTFIPTGTPISLKFNTTNNVLYFPTGILPGSITLTSSGHEFKDKNERLERADASVIAFEQVQIDYVNGVIQLLENSYKSSNQTITYTPAAVRTYIPHTGSIHISDNNRNFTYVLQLEAKPARRSFQLSYQYLNKWYTIHDDGTGNLLGTGSGQINYETGSVAVTLNAQPDANSVVFYRWTDVDDFDAGEAESFVGNTPTVLNLKQKDITPGTIAVTWTQGSVTKTATDNGAGALIGDSAGGVAYEMGQVRIDNANPDSGTDWNITYTYNPPAQKQSSTIAIAANTNRANVTFALPAGIKPGTVNFTLKTRFKRKAKRLFESDLVEYKETSLQFFDDGDGNLCFDLTTMEAVGTINYATGAASITGTAILSDKKKTKERWEV